MARMRIMLKKTRNDHGTKQTVVISCFLAPSKEGLMIPDYDEVKRKVNGFGSLHVLY